MLADPKLDIGKEVQAAVDEFGFPALSPDHLQYFACEKRQWSNHLAQEGMTDFPSAWNHPYMHEGLRLTCLWTTCQDSMVSRLFHMARKGLLPAGGLAQPFLMQPIIRNGLSEFLSHRKVTITDAD